MYGFNFDTTYTSLPEQFFTELRPEAVTSPKVVVINVELASSMGLDFSNVSEKDLALLFSGTQLPKGATPFAEAYAGHQFGHFTILGDGRAHVLGEHLAPDKKRVDIQFKGSGKTPYSRSGDGKAVLGPMLREYIISEAMYALNIPTTRSLAVVSTGEAVRRETVLPGAMLTRVASSHIRVGTFEFAAYQGGEEAVSAIMNYTIKRHYPHLTDSNNKALALIEAVMEKQADLIVDWMRVGFIHGVMNTDNMTLSGETIDYGPCAFMDAYDPQTVFSSIDRTGRYGFGNQPKIAQWNLARLAETLLPFIGNNEQKAIEAANETINYFANIFEQKWHAMMCNKLGLQDVLPGDKQLIADLLSLMQKHQADYTNTFYELSKSDKPCGSFFEHREFQLWRALWEDRRGQNSEPLNSSIELMKNTNPALIPRNHKVEEALAAAETNEFEAFHNLVTVLKEPYNYKDGDSLKPYQSAPEPSQRVYQTFCGT